MASRFKVTDRVRRTAVDTSNIRAGSLGTVVKVGSVNDPDCIIVNWDDGQEGYPYWPSHQVTELEPAPATAPGQCNVCGFIGGGCCLACMKSPCNRVEPMAAGPNSRHWTQTLEPAAAVRVCSSECEERKELRAKLVRANSELLRERDKLTAQLAEATGAKLRVGDIMGENEHLRSRVAELEAALGFAERELCRMKRGRR